MLVVSICLGVGCTPLSEVHPHIPSQELSADDRAEILIHLKARSSSSTTLRALYRASMQIDGERQPTLRYAVVAHKPDSLRIEILPTTSLYPLALLTSSGGRASYRDHANAEQVNELDERELLARYLHIPLQSSELISLLFGDVPAAYLSRPDLHLAREAETGRVILWLDDLTIYFVLAPEDFGVEVAEFRDLFSQSLKIRALISDHASHLFFKLPSFTLELTLIGQKKGA